MSDIRVPPRPSARLLLWCVFDALADRHFVFTSRERAESFARAVRGRAYPFFRGGCREPVNRR
jgi:hypothetical protein